MDAARTLRTLLDRLAAVRWAPLAADAALNQLVADPAARLAGLAPDPLAALAGVMDTAPASAVAASDRARRAPRSVAAGAGISPRRPPLAVASGEGAARAAYMPAPIIDISAPRFRAAQPSTPVLPRVTLPAAPLPQSGAAPAGAPPVGDHELLRRFASAFDAVPLNAERLRELLEPARQRRPEAGHKRAVALLPRAGSTATAPEGGAKGATAANRAMATSAGASASDAWPPSLPTQPSAPPDAAFVPHGRTSALADLLRRWPGSAAPATHEVQTARSQLAAVLPTPDTAAHAWPAGTQPVGAPAQPADLARPAQPTSDLQFGRTLERVLLAEVRRQGLDLEPE